MKIKHFALKYYPLFAIALLVIILFVVNYRPGTILSGWDNLHPEFNFGVNIKRSIFAVWQEYQGLGLLGGMAHATDLLRQLFLLFLSLFLPMDSLRYVWTFLMLFVGAAGTYFLIGHTFSSDKHTDNNSSQIVPFLGAVFYILNLSTLQMFSVPYESFVGFFGFLPWLLFASLRYLHDPSRRNVLLLVTVLILATPSWYLQTVFIVFLLSLTILITPQLLKKPYKKSLLGPAKLYFIIFLINSFWLLPAAYFTITSSQININSKINQMATETIFLQNKEFGTLPDVMLLKGFMLNGVDPNSKGTITYMLAPLRDHLSNPFVSLIGFSFFAIIFVGFIRTLKSKNSTLKGLSFLFIFSFIALAIDTFPFTYINSLFRNYIPIVNQIFRFPFTKFSTLVSLVFAVLFALGIQQIMVYIKHTKLKIKISPLILYTVPFILLIIFTLPAFQGNLFYEKERAKIPGEYYQLFTFFQNQDQNTRIANLPQHTFWGWSFYNWPEGDYGGSGFTWYGIKQPILDRAFDVWSNYTENYYFEISHAVYSKNPKKLEQVLNKYQITWLLVDKNIFDTASSKALFFPELEELLKSGSYAKKTASFGKLDVYKINLSSEPKNYVFLAEDLPAVNKYKWNNNDYVYSEIGNYISANSKEPIANSYFFPFRSLFSLKSQKDKEFLIRENSTNIEFTAQVPAISDVESEQTEFTLDIPSFIQKEKLIPVQIKTVKTGTGTPRLQVKLLLPEIFLEDTKLTTDEGPLLQAELPTVNNDQLPLKINVNGASSFSLSDEDKDVGIAFFTLDTQNVITVSDKSKQSVIDVRYEPDIFSEISLDTQSISFVPNNEEKTLMVRFPKINDGYLSFTPKLGDAEKIQNCYNFRSKDLTAKTVGNQAQILSSTDATGCTSFFAKNLPHDQSFAIFIKSRHITGQALRFWIENIDQQYSPLDTYLPKASRSTISSFILPPMEQFGASYSFHFDNASIGRSKTINEINNLSVYPIFYNYLQSIQIGSGDAQKPSAVINADIKVSHPNESLYIVSYQPIANSQQPTLVLSQSYDPGWKAYAVSNNNWLKTALPFIFGREINDHVMVNNWENGWMLNEPKMSNGKWQMVIVYMPQYLQYLGFALLIGVLLFVIHSTVRRKRS